MARHRRGGQPDRRLDLRLSGVPFGEVEESDRQDTDSDWLGSSRRLARRFPGRRDRDLLYGEDCVSTVRGKGNARFQIVAGEVGEILEDLIFGPGGSPILQPLIDPNAAA